MNEAKKEIIASNFYGNDALLSKEDFIKTHKISLEGLSSKEAFDKISTYGPNEIKQGKQKKWYNYLLKSLFSPFNSILLGISAVLFYTDVILAQTPSYANIIVIIVLVLASTLLEFVEEFRSNQAAEKLKSLVETSATVIRNNEKLKIPVKDVTLGDLVLLSAGDMIPADLRIIESKDLYVGQSSLTGESDAVKKLPQTELNSANDIESIADLDTICFMGTNVISRKCQRCCY